MFASGCQRLASWARVGQACRGMARGLSSSMPPGEGKGLVRPDRERGLFALLGEGACSPETEPQKAALTSVVWEGGLRNTGPGGPAPRTPAPSGRQPPRGDRRAGTEREATTPGRPQALIGLPPTIDDQRSIQQSMGLARGGREPGVSYGSRVPWCEGGLPALPQTLVP